MEHSGAYFLGALAPFIHISKKSYHIRPYNIWILLLPDAWTIFVFKVPWNTTLLFVLVSVSMNSQGQETPERERLWERESQHRFEGSSNPDTLSGKDTISAVTHRSYISVDSHERGQCVVWGSYQVYKRSQRAPRMYVLESLSRGTCRFSVTTEYQYRHRWTRGKWERCFGTFDDVVRMHSRCRSQFSLVKDSLIRWPQALISSCHQCQVGRWSVCCATRKRSGPMCSCDWTPVTPKWCPCRPTIKL